MNRRRFLAMLGILPAALALPSVVGQPTSKVRVTTRPSSLAQDVKYGRILAGGPVPGPVNSPQLVKAHSGETVLPTRKPRTLAERAEARELAEAAIRVAAAYAALAASPLGIEALAASDALEALQRRHNPSTR